MNIHVNTYSTDDGANETHDVLQIRKKQVKLTATP